LVAILAGLFLTSFGCSLTSAAQSHKEAGQSPLSTSTRPAVEWDRKIPLTIQSSGVEWGGHTYHLVRANAIQFDLNKDTGHLKAELQVSVTSFDQVDYEIGAALFGAEGELLGVAKTQCKIDRLWLGRVLHTDRTLLLDFGESLAYANARTFMLSISERKVLTPSDWQAAK
jgi:hypothetical protein